MKYTLIWKRTVNGKAFFYHSECVKPSMRNDEIGVTAWSASMVEDGTNCQVCGNTIHVKSKRKPFNDCAGYVASRINALTGIANVIYVASEQGIDADHKYITVCEAHKQMISSSNIPSARIDMKDATQWCSACQHLRGV